MTTELRYASRNAHSKLRFVRWLAITLIAMVGGPVLPAAAQDDVPGRVGRVATFRGELLLAPQDRPDQWSPVEPNYPITQGDSLWSGADGTAELDFGGGQVRLGPVTNVQVSRLDDRQLALFVAEGSVIVRVRYLDAGDSVVVDLPAAQATLLRAGLYRIDVGPNGGSASVSVRDGEAGIATADRVQQVLRGQSATLEGADLRRVTVGNGSTLDSFDLWSADRDRVYEVRRNAAYVSPQMVGAADLDAYGSWQTYPDYGAVWFPANVAVAWAPYRYGHWVSLGVWGPTWVDDAPWGYAPFHYGRWVYVGGRWGWCPGTYAARPLWAPALVAWYGGSGWNVAIGAGGPAYGWVPLSWREAFRPWWGSCSDACWNRYNRPYAVNPIERSRPASTIYANWRAPNGVTAISANAFVGGRPVQNNVVAMPARPASPPAALRAPPTPRLAEERPVVRPGSNGVPFAASTINPAMRAAPATSVVPPRGSGPAQRAPIAPAQERRRGSGAPSGAPPTSMPSSSAGQRVPQTTAGRPINAAPPSTMQQRAPQYRGQVPPSPGQPAEAAPRAKPVTPQSSERNVRSAPPSQPSAPAVREYRPPAAAASAPQPRTGPQAAPAQAAPAPHPVAPALQAHRDNVPPQGEAPAHEGQDRTPPRQGP